MLTFASASGTDGRHFAVWRALLAPEAAAGPGGPAVALETLRRAAGPWVVLLSSGGHFAAAVFSPNPTASPNSNPKPKPNASSNTVRADDVGGGADPGAAGVGPGGGSAAGEDPRRNYATAGGAADGPRAPCALARPLEVLAHKTFHRYVVRCARPG